MSEQNEMGTLSCKGFVQVTQWHWMVWLVGVISWWSVLLVEETRVPGKNHRPITSH
jgi:hypothetical protein